MKKAKLIGAIIGVILFSILITGLTYAWYTWRSSDIIISGTTKCFKINYVTGKVLNNESAILFDESAIINENQITIKSGMALTSLTAALDTSCGFTSDITINLTVNSLDEAFTEIGESTGALKYVFIEYDPTVYTDITTEALNGTVFDIAKTGSVTQTGSITLGNDSLLTTDKGYMLLFYVDGDLALDDAQDATFSASIGIDATQTVE